MISNLKLSCIPFLLTLNCSNAFALSSEMETSTLKSELVATIINGFAIQDFLTVVKNASMHSNEWKSCVISNDTALTVKSALSKEVEKNVQPLNEIQLTEYINVFKNGGTSALSKYYQSNYQNALLLSQGQKVSTRSITRRLLNSFNEEEKKAWSKFDTLPNKEVREMITPIANPDREIFRTMAFNLTMRWAVEDSCKQFLDQTVQNGNSK